MADPESLTPTQMPAEPPAPQSPELSNSIFRGPNGIRAGWRVLIFLAIVAALFAALIGGLALFARGRAHEVSQLTPLGVGLSEAAIFIFASIAALIMAHIEGRKYGQYGLPLRHAFRKDFWVGTLVGFLALSACLFAMFLLHGFHITGLAIRGRTIIGAAAAWTAAFVIVGLAEEFAFRGYLQFTLTTGMGYWPAAILLSCLFALAHAGNPGESVPGLIDVVIVALLFCLFLQRTGNLWWAVGFHAGWDWGQTFFYGVRDSGAAPYHNLLNSTFQGPRWLTGGTVGPEASLFTPIVIGIVAIVFAQVYRENRYKTS